MSIIKGKKEVAGLPQEDLEHILDKAAPCFEKLRGKRLFITGGTGFFGSWLLESFAWANDRLKLNSSAVVLTRNPEGIKKTNPHLYNYPAIDFLRGDIKSFKFPKGRFEYIIHAAVENNYGPNFFEMFENNIAGTRRILEFARLCKNESFLFTSSGAVYGEQPAKLTHISEDYRGAPEMMKDFSAYGECKRVSEFYCSAYAKKFGINTRIARCFAFMGPGLPLDAGFAVGNFIRDALKGGPIEVKSNKTVYRSYLYAADLTIWLMRILVDGEICRPYNVGSSESITILGLAEKVAQAFDPEPEIVIQSKIDRPEGAVARYVPDTYLAEKELKLKQWISLKEGIRRMADFYSKGG
jgi:dTDP-glucose 4,6-dehydratase